MHCVRSHAPNIASSHGESGERVAALRVVGDDLEPAEVTALLGSEPSEAWARGEERNLAGVTRKSTLGNWMLEAEQTSPADIDAQVTSLLDRLTGDLTTWTDLAERWRVSLFCGWFWTWVTKACP